MTSATTTRRPDEKRNVSRKPAAKPTAYGKAVLRAIDRMKAVGPWEFAPKLSDRYFKR